MKEKIFSTFFIKVFAAALNFFIVIMLSQILGADGRGEASIILTTISIVVIFSQFVGGGSLIYLIPRNHLKSIVVTSYIWSLGVSIIAYFFIEYIFSLKEDYVLYIAVISFITSVTGTNSSILIAKERVGQSNLIQISQVIINLMALLVLFYFFKNKSVDSYVFSLCSSSILSFIVSLLFIFGDIKKEKSNKITLLFAETLRFGTMNQIAHVTQFLSFRTSYYIIEKFWGNGMVGIYSNGVSIAETIWIVARSIALVQLSKITNTEDDKASRNLTIKLTRTTVLISTLLIIPLLLMPNSFYAFVFGHEFSELAKVILVIAPGIIFFALALVVGYYFSGRGKFEINALSSSIGLIVTLVLGFILIPLTPIWGAGITASLSYFATAFVVVYVFFKKEKESWLVLIPNKKDWKLLLNKIKK